MRRDKKRQLASNGKEHAGDYGTHALLNFTKDSYFERTSRPVYAIFFLLPFIVIYELGTIFINTNVLNQTTIRVVAFVWLQNFLDYIGFGGKLAWMTPALVVLVTLVALQLASRRRWSFYMGDVLPMAVECILLSAPLIVLSLFMNSSPASPPADANSACLGYSQAGFIKSCSNLFEPVLAGLNAHNGQITRTQALLADIITGIGAGIYEELVFRLVLICLLVILFQDVLRFGRRDSIVLSVLVSAALFSAHHHIDFISGQLNPTETFSFIVFTFRTIAGVYFAVLFAARGFGITAGTHAFYNIIATIINAAFFRR